MSVNGYLFSAYLVIWTILFFYLVYLNRKQQEVGKQLKALTDSIHDHTERSSQRL
ncbi:MAG: CcmD family protein [Acidobacteriota bacterium]